MVAWVSLLPIAVQLLVRRAIEMDRRVWTEHPDSLASGLFARTVGVENLEGLREA